MKYFITVLVVTLICFSGPASGINVTYNINTDVGRTPISKYVYGSNWGNSTDYTIQRTGGNRCTAYNWENNWSNAGGDWYYENDQFFTDSPIAGKGITDTIDQFILQGQESIVTLQMAGYVSAPLFRQINLATEAAPSIYFYPVVFAKGAPFCNPPGEPDNNDGVVYMDEFVNFLVRKYGYAGTASGMKFYSLDNEVDCWSDGNKGATHPEVHPADPCALEIKNKGVALSTAVKNVDPNAQILGPDLMGFSGFLDMGGASDWSSVKGNRPWYISYYLDEMKIASNAAGRRLLDVLDVHWYPEAQDGAGHRILDGSINTTQMYNARMQAPRTLWDTGYISPNETYPNGEESWINKWYFAQYLPILTRFKADIQNYYPDTNISITEYSYGPEIHWSTGIATVDFLGICGKYGVYIANYWGQGSYVDAAIKMYRNYDGAHSTFGDVNVYASMSNKVDSSIYASIFGTDTNELHLIVINKNQDNAINGTFNITSTKNYTAGRVWLFDSSSPAITEATPVGDITNNSFTYSIPAATVCHIVLQGVLSLRINRCIVRAGATQYHDDNDYSDMKDSFEASGTIWLPDNYNDIDTIGVNITSGADGQLIYVETLNDFNPGLVSRRGRYTHKARVYRGQEGKITSLKLDFHKRTFALKAKNIDLTGLACPVQLGFTLAGQQITGQADESVVNGRRRPIPARLMRLYEDTLIVTRARIANRTSPSYDSLTVKGNIAVADMDLGANEPNLVTQDLVLTFGDINDINTPTFSIPAGSFKVDRKRHLYNCRRIHPVITPFANVNTLITAGIDLDKCTFSISIIRADLDTISGELKFGLSFEVFSETDEFDI